MLSLSDRCATELDITVARLTELRARIKFQERTCGVATHAFLYSNGTMQDLGTLGGPNSYGYGISASGQVTGNSYTKDRAIHAFLCTNGHMIDLNSRISSGDAALYTLTYGQAINDKVQVMVDATVNATGSSVALLLTPTKKDSDSE
jgi:probable HAF family extracellular repeat protein